MTMFEALVGVIAGKRRKIETHWAGTPCGTKESGARDFLPMPGLHKAKGAPRPPGIGGWLLVVDCWPLPTHHKSLSKSP